MIKTQGVVHFSLPVTDLERSAKFYSELLGMRIVQKTPRMVFLQCGDDYLILAKGNTPLKYDSSEETPVPSCFQSCSARL
jgi:catechol 2,3-dioxygenase-like lactoylglutathione lyase family enzyme